MWKVLAGLLVGVAIGLAVVPVYNELRPPAKPLTDKQIAVATLKRMHNRQPSTEYKSAKCERRQYPDYLADCTVEASYMSFNQKVKVRRSGVTLVGDEQLISGGSGNPLDQLDKALGDPTEELNEALAGE